MPWLHHVLGHFPLALSPLAVGVLVLARLRRSEALATATRWLVYLTAASAVSVAATGLLSAGHFVESGGDAPRMELHRNLALGATALSVLAAGLTWIGAKQARRILATLGQAATVGTAGLVAVAGDVGGSMLHPGLAPWSEEPHHHGPAALGSSVGDHPDPGTTGTVEQAAPPADRSAPALSAAPEPSAPPSATAPAPTPQPRSVRAPLPKPKVPAPAAPEDHSGHQH